MMLTIKPDTRAGGLILLNEDGDPVGIGIARASRNLPGYVTVVATEDKPDGTKFTYALRLPCDWLCELARLEP